MRAIAIRLTIAFLCIIFFLIVQGFYSFYAAQSLSDVHQAALNDELNLRILSENLSQARLTVYKILGTMDPKVMDEAWAEFRVRVESLGEQLNNLGIDPYLIGKNKEAYEQIIGLQYDFSARAAREQMEGPSLEIHEALVRAMEARSLASMLKAQEHLLAVRDRTITYTAGLGIAALATALIWALVLMRSLIDRRAAESAIAASESKYREIFNNILDVFYQSDPDGKLQIVSPSVQKLLGYTPEELVGANFSKVYMDLAQRDEFIRELRSRGEVSGYEIQAIAKNGTGVWISINARLLKDAGGNEAGIQGVARDISESKRIAEERKEFEARLQQAEKMEAIGTLAGGIAHDFNNILSAIVGYAELSVYADREGKKSADYLHQIIAAATRARDLVQQILTFSRKAPHEKKPLDIAPIVTESLNFIRASLPTTIDIQYWAESDLGLVMADSTQIQQVFMNLGANAAHAMKETGGVLRVELSRADGAPDSPERGEFVPPGRWLKISISDTGAGIPPELQDRIFEPFFTTKGVGEGTGMGLAVVHGIVSSHGGEIIVQSEVGRGTRFDIFLPLIESEITEPVPPVRPAPVGGADRVLLVDDEEAILDVNREILERLGYAVESRSNGQEALEAILANPQAFDLVVTDLSMPLLSGKDLAKRILEIRPDLPVVLCTGFGDSITPDQLEALGIKAFLNKPITIEVLARTIRQVLDEAAGARSDPSMEQKLSA